MRDAKHVEARVAKARDAARAPHGDITVDSVGNSRHASTRLCRRHIDARCATIGVAIQSIVFLQKPGRVRNCAKELCSTTPA
ncbi:hypothetical protein [Methylocapsa aurea]|uniref:hypothetical protein n=1 Tax=Methylocapsa aurea TaxID=663610 RepID=UPI003D18DC69